MKTIVIRKTISQLLFLLAIVTPFAAYAQETTPYAPKAAKGRAVIFPLTYQDSPLLFPFEEVSHSRVADELFYNFQYDYSKSFQELVDFFKKAQSKGETLSLLNTKTVRFAKSKDVKIVGSSMSPKAATFTVASIGKPYQFSFTIYPTRQGSKIVVKGMIASNVFSGFVPWRAPFKPADAQPIPFRWN